MAERIGIVGLGRMGRPVGRHLRMAGYLVAGCDPVEDSRAAAAALGIDVRDSPAEVAADADLVLVLVGFDLDVEAALFGPDGILASARPGLVLAMGSTISPSYAGEIAERLAGRDIALVDLPTARGEAALEKGALLIFGGGDRVAFDRWRPAFESFATDIFFLGAFGAGQAAKMANNMILWACTAANVEAMALAEVFGVDPEALRAALGPSSAGNWSLATGADHRPIPWAEKDLRIALEEADRARLSLPLAGVVKEAIKAHKIRRGFPIPRPRRGG